MMMREIQGLIKLINMGACDRYEGQAGQAGAAGHINC
jgi:hypothetical protein